MTNEELKKYLQPGILSSINNLEFIAKLIVEGFITGLHKSPFHGFSVEFSQHRPYMQGDSLRYVDWKVYARSDRYYIKQFEEETNLRCYLLLDISKSMTYGSSDLNKLQFSSILTASLAYLMLKQRDATGLLMFDDSIQSNLPARSVPVYIKEIVTALHNINPGNDTNITNALHTIADKIKRRGLIIVISDLLDDPENILNGMRHLRYNEHEIIVFHVMDEQEADFNFKGEFLFEDLESTEKIKTDARYIKEAYLKKFKEHCQYFKSNLSENNIDYLPVKTNETIASILTEYLIKRSKLY